jgi:hypothetical protein
MTMQRLCHARRRVHAIAAIVLLHSASPLRADPTMHDYPTEARVEYVNECMSKSRGQLASLYQCSCVIDRIAAALSYDDFVEASTFARYSGLGGEAGAVFRDSERAKKLAQFFRDTESAAKLGCGLAK